MNPLYYFAFLIYLLALVVTTPVVCILVWRARAEARQRRRGDLLAWLTPMTIGACLSLLGAALIVCESFLHVRAVLLHAFNYFLFACTAPFSIVASLRLWKMVRALPPWAGDMPPPPGPSQEGVWPPPPHVR